MKNINIRRLAIFCHFDKDNLIDDYVVAYLQGLRSIAEDIQFVSHSSPNQDELKKIERYVQKITLKENCGLDFGAWQEIIAMLGLPYIAEHYDQLILVNDSCYGPLSPFSELFGHMSIKNLDMWGITENHEPYYIFKNGKILNITPHIQSYFLVFNKTILRAPCFSTFWRNVKNLASRDEVILECEVGLTTLLRKHDFKCGTFIIPQSGDMNKLKNTAGEPLHDLSLFYWYELIEKKNPLLKVKAIPMTLKWNKKLLKKFEKKLCNNHDARSFCLIDNHLLRTSENYKFSKICLVKKIALLLQYCINQDNANIYAASTFRKYKNSIQKKYSQGGIKIIIFFSYHAIKQKFIRLFIDS